MAADFRVISIGTLPAHPLWGEDQRNERRTGHATTTLISAPDGAQVLVDPSLPPAALLARLGERAPVAAGRITHVFLTSADPLHRRAIEAFPDAAWLAHPDELDAARGSIAGRLAETAGGDESGPLEREQALLERCRPAPDRLAEGVDLFPLPGVTPGCCGLLLPLPRATVLVCGDAVATTEHLRQGQVLPGCHDVEQARESFAEAIQIADVLVPGRDNVEINPLRRPFGL